MENSKILKNPSENEIIDAIDQNQSDFLKKGSSFVDKDEIFKIYPKAEISSQNDVSIFFMGINHPAMNMVTEANFNEQNVEEKVNKLISRAKEKNLPFVWNVGSLSKPHNLGEYLAKAGLMKDESPGMYLNLRELNVKKYNDFLNQSKIEIELVSNLQQENQWIDVCMETFEMNNFKDDVKHVWSLFFNISDAFIAILEGKPVGASMVFYSSGVAGVYNVAVRPEYQNRGIGTAITMAALNQAKKKGYEISTIVSSEMGFKVYSKIGYKECCKNNQYIFIPQPNEEN